MSNMCRRNTCRLIIRSICITGNLYYSMVNILLEILERRKPKQRKDEFRTNLAENEKIIGE